MARTWKPIAGYESLYEVSDDGRVRSLDHWTVAKNGKKRFFHGRVLRNYVDKFGYNHVVLHRDDIRERFGVHAIVAEAFIGPRPEGFHCCHNDSDPTNNTPTNLRWDTQSGNFSDKVDNGTSVRGTANPKAKLSEIEARFIRHWVSTGRWSQKTIAKVFGVGQTTVSSIKNGTTWGWLEGTT